MSTTADPLQGLTSFTYDANGNLLTVQDAKGQTCPEPRRRTTTHTYDALNRRTQASYADATVATFTYDAASRLTQVNDTADPHRPFTRTYDPLDRLLTETTSLWTVTYVRGDVPVCVALFLPSTNGSQPGQRPRIALAEQRLYLRCPVLGC